MNDETAIQYEDEDPRIGYSRRGSDRVTSVLERHLQTVIAFVLTALLLWVAATVTDNSKELARLVERVDSSKAQQKNNGASNSARLIRFEQTLDDLKSSLYTRNEAVEQNKMIMYMLEGAERRITVLEDVPK